MTATLLESNLFDTILGLPWHPLVVHFAVVLLPLSAIGLIICVFSPTARARFATLSTVGVALGTVAVLVAKESGEKLAGHIGLPKQHAEYADIAAVVSGGLMIVAIVWWWLQRRDARADVPGGRASGQTKATGVIAMLLAAASLVALVLVGHTGAQAAWGDVLTASASPSASPTAPVATAAPSQAVTSASPTPTASGLTMAAVKKHATATDCWSVIDGDVYDLSAWVDEHPGGASKIKGICGKDGSDQFTEQHEGESKPNSKLATFRLGALQQ